MVKNPLHAASIIIMMVEALCSSEMSVYLKTAHCYTPEGCNLKDSVYH
jgi:hypothetical protein